MVRVQGLVAPTTGVAREKLAEPLDPPLRFVQLWIDVGDMHDPLPEGQRLLDRFGDAGARVRAHYVAIDNDFDTMLPPVVDLRRLVQAVRLAVYSHAHEAGT